MTAENADLRDMQKVYDSQADAFNEKAPVLLTWEFINKPAILRHFKDVYRLKNQALILDVGSATGRVVQTHVDAGIPANNIWGVEISPQEVKLAKKNIPGAHFSTGDIRTAKLPKNKFDGATSSMVFEFLDEAGLDQALVNIYGSMKKGGKLVYVSTHPGRVEGKYNLTARHSGWFKTGGPWGGDFENWHRSLKDYVKQTESNGFEITEVEELGMPKEAGKKFPERIKTFKTFDAPVRLVVCAHKK